MVIEGNDLALLKESLGIAARCAKISGFSQADNEFLRLLADIAVWDNGLAIHLSDDEVVVSIDALAISVDFDEERYYPLLDHMENNAAYL